VTLLKTCRTCREDKPNTLEFFRAHKSCRDGIDTQCRSCATSYQQSWRTENRTRHLANRRALYAKGGRMKEVVRQAVRDAADPVWQAALRLADGVRNRSKKRGEQVDPPLDSCFFEQWLLSQPHCECCDISFDLGPKNGKFNDASPSVDRFDSSLGYSVENTALICWRCNNIKRNYDARDLRLVASWIERRNETSRFNPQQEIAA
jgi:5-methylcytosine-specific restriction endonuclease McrA